MRHGTAGSDPGDNWPGAGARGWRDRDLPGGGWPGRGRPPRRGDRSSWRRFRSKSALSQAGYVLATLGAVVVLAVGVGAYAVYQNLVGNIHHVHVGGLRLRDYGAENFLILGSQTRQGQKGFFGMASGAYKWTSNSDNLIVVHLDSTHTHAIVLSIPRDTMVYEPACQARIRQIGIGLQGPYQSAIIDGALNIGGPTCAVKTVEDLSAIPLDHFVEVDFNSFRTMVDVLGGVEVCVPKGGYHDPNSHLNLSAGLHLVKYDTALAYVRSRDALGGPDAGGDLPRIQLQQAFMASVVQKVNKSGVLGNIPALYRIADTAARALTVDQGLASPTELLSLAKSLVHLHSKDVTFITMPTIYDPANTNRLLPKEPQDDVLFQLIRDNHRWHGHLPQLPTHRVEVRVLNGAGVSGLAGSTARALRKLGYDVIGTGNAAPTSTTTVSYSGTAQADEAWTLMNSLHALPAAQNLLAEPAPQIGHYGPVTLTLGADYASFAVKPPPVKHPAASKSPSSQRPTAGTSSGTSSSGTSVAASSSAGKSDVQSRNGAASICAGLPPPRSP